MTIQEILEVHLGSEWIEWKHSQCQCGHKFEGEYNSTTRRAHVAEVLDKHMQEREAEAVRETSRYLQRIFPRKGLVNRADILADIEIAADRLGRGIHANGREKEPTNGR